jgi:opacity protein-like surface antigen
MQASIFTSKQSLPRRTLSLALLALALSGTALAADGQQKKDRSLPPEEDDFTKTPFTEYGSFNEDAEEDAETRFMQYGRLFGVSLGVGQEGVTGNRGQLWRGGFPLLELKMHYWFDFQLAIDLAFATGKHMYDAITPANSTVNVTTTRIGVDLKYYFDVKNLSAPISFCNPYILGGAGSFSKTQTNDADQASNDSDSTLYLTAGAGLEFAIKPRKTYFEVEGRIMSATFKDTNDQDPTRGLNDLSGMFYSVTGTFLFTW